MGLARKRKRRINVGNRNFASITPDGKFIIIVTRKSIQKFDLEGNLIPELKASIGPEEKVLHSWSAGTYIGHRYYNSSLDGSTIATIGFFTMGQPPALLGFINPASQAV